MNEPSVSVKNLTKSFSGRRVVDNLSFDVQKGEVFALLGHNGAGKSTTIDLILGLKAPEGGFTKILGTNAAKNRKKVFERVGVQLQNTQYQPNITVEEACIEYASLYSAPADYQQLLEQFGLNLLKKALCQSYPAESGRSSLSFWHLSENRKSSFWTSLPPDWMWWPGARYGEP